MSENNPPIEEMEDYDPDLLTLEDDEGKEHTFEVIDASDFNNIRYLAMVPYNEDPGKQLEEDAELLIMRVEEENDEEYLALVEEEEELNEVAQHFLERLSDVYDIDIDDL